MSLCSRLEELSVDRNLLESAAGVEGLLHLNWLSLSSNRLTELPSLRSLNQLSYFNFSDNFISSLTNLKVLPLLSPLLPSPSLPSLYSVNQLFSLIACRALPHLWSSMLPVILSLMSVSCFASSRCCTLWLLISHTILLSPPPTIDCSPSITFPLSGRSMHSLL